MRSAQVFSFVVAQSQRMSQTHANRIVAQEFRGDEHHCFSVD